MLLEAEAEAVILLGAFINVHIFSVITMAHYEKAARRVPRTFASIKNILLSRHDCDLPQGDAICF